MLGVRPALGRFFTAEEDRTPGRIRCIVVSHAFWRVALGGDDQRRSGETVTVNGRPFTLIGVAPPAFRGVTPAWPMDAWAPLMMQPLLRPRSNLTDASWLWLFGRLRPGVDGAGGAGRAVGADRAQRLADRASRTVPRQSAAVARRAADRLPGGDRGRCSGSSACCSAPRPSSC